MREVLGELKLTKIIVHEIPLRRASGEGEPISFSEAESRVSPEVRNYFREKIVKSLDNNSYDVIFDADTQSPVPGLAVKLLKSPCPGFVDHSCSIGTHLHSCQTGVNKESLLVIALATLAGKSALAVLKLEKEAGLRLVGAKVKGKRTFDLEHLRDLMLSDRTKVFKAGLFRQNGTEIGAITGLVSDNQRSYTPSTEVADFFLVRFLGCQLLEAPEVSTKRFFEAMQRFINEKVSDPNVQARYQIALMAEMANETKSVSPRIFANSNLRTSDRKPFLDALEEVGCPLGRFDKDAGIISAHLQRIQMDFMGGLSILGTPKAIDEQLEMTQLKNGNTRVSFEDQIKNFKGRR